MQRIISLMLVCVMLIALMPFTVSATDGTEGLIYNLSADGTYYIVSDYEGTEPEVVIPSTYEEKPVKMIGNRAFEWNETITDITIPESVIAIGYGVFTGSNLYTINVHPENEVYHSAGNCLVATLTKTLVYACKNATIPDDNSISVIGNGAFSNDTALVSIELPNSVTKIGENAFYGCYGLKSIIIPDSVKEICSYAFQGCVGLKNIEIPNSVETIGYAAFYGCSGLETIVIPDSVKEVDDVAFYDCYNLESVEISASVETMGTYVFTGCTKLKDIYCKADSKPEGWSDYWKLECMSTVHWGYKEEPELELGDVDFDGKITTADYIFVKRAFMGTYTLKDAEFLAADIDKDGVITTSDYVLVKRAFMGTYVIG